MAGKVIAKKDEERHQNKTTNKALIISVVTAHLYEYLVGEIKHLQEPEEVIDDQAMQERTYLKSKQIVQKVEDFCENNHFHTNYQNE
jgi:pyruvate/2-oxoglutarate/acetoin dehydrogenase E1 component